MIAFTVISVCVNSIAVTITRDIAYPLVKRIGGMDIKKVLITIQLTVLVMILTSSLLVYFKNFSLLYRLRSTHLDFYGCTPSCRYLFEKRFV